MSSIVSADKFSVLVILRREYLDITSNFCAAKLIEYFRHWTNWKVKNHRTAWIYKPLKKIYADLMGEHSLHVIRSAIALLEEIGILCKQKNPGNKQDRTWQYKLNFDILNRLLELGRGKIEPSTFNAEQYHRSNPEASKPQQHTAVELEKSEEVEKVDWEVLSKKTEIWEQTQPTHFVEDTELVYSINDSDLGEGNFSAAVEVVEKSNQAVLTEPVQTTHYQEEQELDDSTDEGNYCAAGMNEKSSQPSHQEVQSVLQQLREIPCTPQFRLNAEIQRTVKRCWENVPGAVAYLKEALRTWKGIKSPEAVFVAACKEGRKPESVQAKSEAITWFEWARQQRIVIAMSGSVVYTPDGEAVAIGEMMRRYPLK